MSHTNEDYWDVVFEDFRMRRDVFRALGVESGIAGAEIADGSARDLDGKGKYAVFPRLPYVPSRSAFDKGPRHTIADLIADTPNTVLRK